MPGDNPNRLLEHKAQNLENRHFGGTTIDHEALPRTPVWRRLIPVVRNFTGSNTVSQRLKAAFWHPVGLAAMAIALAPTHALAAEGTGILSGLMRLFSLDHAAVLAQAIFGGAISFSLLSAFWLIRERARIAEENTQLRKSYSGMRLERDRLATLLEVDDLCVAVWSGENAQPRIMGMLKEESGCPQQREDLLAFGKWLTPASAIEVEAAVTSLRSEGKPFTLELATLASTTIEAQGRVSGGLAFIRLVYLDGMRRDLADLTREHDQLLGRFSVIEKLFETMRSPIWIRARDESLAYVNPAYADAVEADDAESALAENRQLFDAKERELIRNALSQEGVHSADLPAVIAGDRKLMESHCVNDKAGSAGLAIDRSDVNAVQAELKHTITSHEQTFNHLASAVAIFDARKRLQFYNSSFQQLWGLSPADLADHPSNGDLLETLRTQSLLPEMPDWKKWKDAQLETYQSTETLTDHWHLPDGRTLRVIVNPQKQGGTSWVFENVTEELALRSNYNSLIRVQGETLDHLNEAVAVFGSDGKVRLTNPAFLKLWEFETQEAVEGRHIREVSDQICKALANAEDWEKISLGITSLDERRADLADRIETASGAVLDYHLVHLPEGQSMLTLADVSAAVNIERALQDRNEALEESDALKTRFIQHVSYELRAPLTSIAGFAEILSDGLPGKLNEKQDEYVGYITRSSDVLKSLIDDILDLASIDAGAMQLNHQKVDLEDIVANCRDGVSDKTERFGIRIETHIDDDARNLVADPDRLRQIVYNLLSNAVGVSPDGSKVRIEAHRKEGWIELAVSDQGPGVPEENRTSIFARFESGSDGERRRGAGLGLSIVKSFVELHGGSVHVDESMNKGARFVCTFPVEPVTRLQAAE